jgi:hypothetical protein
MRVIPCPSQRLEVREDALHPPTPSSGPSTCTASERRSIRTPSLSSISLRFSSRVPNRGSRLGVISRAIFNGINGLRGCTAQPAAVDSDWIVEEHIGCLTTELQNGLQGGQNTGVPYRDKADRVLPVCKTGWRRRPNPVSAKRVARPTPRVNPTCVNLRYQPLSSRYLAWFPQSAFQTPLPHSRAKTCPHQAK